MNSTCVTLSPGARALNEQLLAQLLHELAQPVVGGGADQAQVDAELLEIRGKSWVSLEHVGQVGFGERDDLGSPRQVGIEVQQLATNDVIVVDWISAGFVGQCQQMQQHARTL